MKKNRFFIFIFLIYINFICNADTYKVIGKYIKLEVNEKDGRFLIYGKNDLNKEWIPLLFEDYPYTSFFRIFVDKNDISFGDQGNNRNAEIKFDNNKVIYFWENHQIKVELIYQLISSGKTKYSDTLIIDMKIQNISFTKIILDYFLTLDTYLGESSNNHFIVNKDTIRSEKEIINPDESIIIKSENKDLKLGLNVFFNQVNQVNADRIYFTNWKRVEQNIGLFKTFDKRQFDLEPYSKNDSAIFIEYNDMKIGAQNDKKFRFILSMQNNIELLNENENLITEKIDDKKNLNQIKGNENKNIDNKNVNDPENKDINKNIDNKNLNNNKNIDLINMNLNDLLKLLDAINKKLESGELISDEDVSLINKILEEVRKRRNIK